MVRQTHLDGVFLPLVTHLGVADAAQLLDVQAETQQRALAFRFQRREAALQLIADPAASSVAATVSTRSWRKSANSMP